MFPVWISCLSSWVWISEIFVCRMERYFPPGRTDLALVLLWAHFPPRITWQNAEGLWWSGCFKCHIKLLHVENFNTHSEFNSSLIFMRKTYKLFSQESMQTRQTDHRKFGTTSPNIFQEIRSLTISSSIKNTLQLWQIILHPVVSTRKTRRHLVAFHH